MLSQGGFGSVWLARQVRLDRLVVVKFLKPEAMRDPMNLRRFRDEARFAAALSHENIVRVLDSDVEDGIPWIAYEYIEGPSLHERGRPENLLAITQVLDVAQQTAAALEAAHAHEIIHRDIKPSNILEARPGLYKVTDFGAALCLDESTIRTMTGAIVGTAGFVSPEMVLTGKTTPASDLYSLGATMFKLLTGALPFPSTRINEMLACHVKAPAPPPSSVRQAVPLAVDRVVLTAMAKAPAMRYPSAHAMGEAIALARREIVSGVKTPRRTGGSTGASPAAPAPARKGSGKAAIAAGEGTEVLVPSSRPEAPRLVRVAPAALVLLAALGAGVVWAVVRRPAGRPLAMESARPTRANPETPSPGSAVPSPRSGEPSPGSAVPSPGSTVVPEPVSSPELALEANRITGFDGGDMVLVPAGWFLMGSDKGRENERPERRVWIGAFYIDEVEVTNRRFARFLRATSRRRTLPSAPAEALPDSWWTARPDDPVVDVTWDDADAYARWAHESLPTEAQWEKSARGTDGRTYPWGEADPQTHASLANFNPAGNFVLGAGRDTRGGPAPVGSYPAGRSPLGALDMAGNAAEWCQDWYSAGYFAECAARHVDRDPPGPGPTGLKVVKGGSWDSRPAWLRSAARAGRGRAHADDKTGFRCVRELR